MTGSMIGLAVEGLVAVLLAITIGYCIVLNSRLRRLRADESLLRATIGELVTATGIAERAIGGLKQAASECDKTLAKRVREAEFFSIEIAREIGEGERVLERIMQIAQAARPGHPLSDPAPEVTRSAPRIAAAAERQVGEPAPAVLPERRITAAADLRARAAEATERLASLRRTVEGEAA
jgi:hypothetical protein